MINVIFICDVFSDLIFFIEFVVICDVCIDLVDYKFDGKN